MLTRTVQEVKRGSARMLGVKAIRIWFSYLERHCSKHTVKSYKLITNRFYPFLPKYVESLALEHLENYLGTLDRLSRASQNCHITCLKAFGRFLSERGIENPIYKLKYLKTVHKPQRCLTEAEYHQVLKVAGESRWIVELLAMTGIRVGELLSIRPDHIQDGFLYVSSKGRTHAVPLNKTARKILNNPSHLYLLKNLKYHQVYNLFIRLSQQCNIKTFSAHALRRFYATQLAAKNVGVYFISKSLGHSNISTTEKYYFYFQKSQLKGITDVLDNH